MVIAVGNDRLFVKFAEVMGRLDWLRDPRFCDGRVRASNRLEFVALLEPLLKAQPRDHWLDLFAAAGVPCAPVNDVAELAQSEQLATMDVVRTLPESGMKVIGLPISFDRQRPHPRSDSPKLGAHTKEVFGSDR